MPTFDYFVIFAEMRTGSNFLEACMNAIPGVQCYGEAFNPHFIGHKDSRAMLGISLASRTEEPARLLAAMQGQTDGLPGFRFFHDHDPRILAHVLEDRRCAKIVLTRSPVESYVSLKIAEQTGQWKLTDMKHQKTAQVRFDRAEFRAHLDDTQGFQKNLMHALRVSGQNAFYLGYDDIAELDVLNGLARFLGVSGRLDEIPRSLKKQNPAPLSEKVENFDELQAALGELDPYDLTHLPNFEPSRGPGVPGYMAADGVPLLYMPVRGGPVARAETWLQTMGGDKPLLRGLTQKTLRQWKRRNPGHRSFTIVTHPAERAHHAFCSHILGDGPGVYNDLRETLRKAYKLPIPEAAPGKGYGPAEHRKAFLAFLGFLKGNLAGQTSVRVDGAWASQSNLLQGMAQFGLPDMVMRAESLERDMGLIAQQVGATTAPLDDAVPDEPFGLAAIYDEAVETAVRDVYQRDFMAFGYQAWR